MVDYLSREPPLKINKKDNGLRRPLLIKKKKKKKKGGKKGKK